MKERFLLFVCMFWMLQPLYSQEEGRRTCIAFRMNGSVIDSTYEGNAERLRELEAFLRSLRADSLRSVAHVRLDGYASPDGSVQWNSRLAQKRLAALEGWVRERLLIADTLVVKGADYISWQYLISLVENSDFAEKDTVLKILGREPELVACGGNRQVDKRVLALKRLRGGALWKELNVRFFEPMRRACVTVVLLPAEPGMEGERAEVDTVRMVATDTLSVAEQVLPRVSPVEEKPLPAGVPGQEPVVQEEYGHKLHVKTNLAGWALLLSNAAVEVDLWRHWSFAFGVYYSGWDYFVQRIKFRTIAIQPEVRYWFGDNDGWFVGAHMSMAYFNMALNKDYRVQDRGRETPALGGGLSGGYRMHLGKSRHWKMEFALGAGAYRVHYDRFRNERDGLLVDSKRRTYVGLDNVAVSVAYMFNLKKRSR